MTTEEENDLRAWSDDLAKAAQNLAEPRCVARAFATPVASQLTLTMQCWIDLEAISSPLLRLETPAEVEDLERAARVFALSLDGMAPEEAAHVWRAMRRTVTEAFALALPMQRPGGTLRAGQDGFGAWLPLLAFLIVECGIDPVTARKMRVDHAFALLAACRRNQGWECAGASYAQRDALNGTTDPKHS